MYNCSYYGNYRTRTFADIFSTGVGFMPDVLINDYKVSGLYVPGSADRKPTLTDENLEVLSYLLYARYGNSHIASSDETQFKYKLYSIIFQYGPTWQDRLNLQDKLRNLTDDDLLQGSKQINNHALGDANLPSTASLEETLYINQQSTQNIKKSKFEAYSVLLETLRTDVTKDFLDRFQNLFIKIAVPDRPLWYVSEEEEA